MFENSRAGRRWRELSNCHQESKMLYETFAVSLFARNWHLWNYRLADSPLAYRVRSTDFRVKERLLAVYYCLIARDILVAMLVVKTNSLSLCWELNFIFMQILRNKMIIVLFWPPTWLPCHVSETKELLNSVSIYIYASLLDTISLLKTSHQANHLPRLRTAQTTALGMMFPTLCNQYVGSLTNKSYEPGPMVYCHYSRRLESHYKCNCFSLARVWIRNLP